MMRTNTSLQELEYVEGRRGDVGHCSLLVCVMEQEKDASEVTVFLAATFLEY